MGSIDRRKRLRHDDGLKRSVTSTLTDGNRENTNEKLLDGQVDDDKESPPESFICPLTMEVMFDPVLDSEGNTYERQALLEWLKANHTSPISRQPLSKRMVIPNIALRDAIHDFMGNQWVESKTKEFDQTGDDTKVSYSSKSRHRAKVALYLEYAIRKLEGLRGCTLKLNEEGCCAFLCSDFTVILDVPDNVEVFCLYTRNLIRETLTETMKDLILELNFLQGDTRGGCISTKRHDPGQPPEVIFSYTDRISEVSEHDFSNILLNFVETAAHIRNRIESVRSPTPCLTPYECLRHSATTARGRFGFQSQFLSSPSFVRSCETVSDMQISRSRSTVGLGGQSSNVNHSLPLPAIHEALRPHPDEYLTIDPSIGNNRFIQNDSLQYSVDRHRNGVGVRPHEGRPSTEHLALRLELHRGETPLRHGFRHL